jgi:hypothetical protein
VRHDPIDRTGRLGQVVDWWAVAVADEAYRHGIQNWLLTGRRDVDLLRSLALDLKNLGMDDESAVRASWFVMSRWGSGFDSDVDDNTARLARQCIDRHVRPAMPREVTADHAVVEGGTRSVAPAPALRVAPSVAGARGSWTFRTE